MVGYYTKDHKVYQYEMTEAEAQEALALRKKQLMARQMTEKKEREQYVFEHSKGYCQTCFMLLPMTGKCECCGGEQ